MLRAVNLPRSGKVAMTDLRRALGALGFADVVTLLQSGNVVFRGGRGTTAALEGRLEAGAQARLVLTTEFFARTAAEWHDIVARNPFAAAAKDDPSHLVVLLLKHPTGPAQVKRLQAAITGPEQVRGSGSHVYMTYPAGIGTSKVTNAVIERHLGARVTGRNWNTVLKLDALVH
ncbi:MAG: DUF1697 domain-containing protein [Gemmatimonadales bacterium]